jgi:4-diphosphocytidyl-2-C-methyl-D-erythritol kinase
MGVTIIERCAPAKLNLFLHVTGKRADGYHLLDSLVTFCDVADRVSVQAASSLTLSVTGPFARMAGPMEDNLVRRAAKALNLAAGTQQGAAIALEKNIPAGAGLGGGSADAAATLLALNDLWALGFSFQQLADIGLALGADIPVCLLGQSCRMTGIGEILDPVPALPPLALVLVHPGHGLATPQVFKALAGRWSGPASEINMDLDFIDALRSNRNDLEAPARELMPDIGQMLDALSALPGCRLARMSGSGSACFGLFDQDNEAQAAASILKNAHKNWWVDFGRLIDGQG